MLCLPVIVALSLLPQKPLVSPEVNADHSVTFRFLAPNAKAVAVGIEGRQLARMTKDAQGVWSVTTEPLAPDYYGYTFMVDFATALDPANPLTKPNLIWPSNLLKVPGNPPQVWEEQPVPHGVVHHHRFESKVTGGPSDFYVYTPPSYSPTGKKKFPVLCLLHGFSDMASGWTTVGQAHVILDNLIASGEAKPMVVIMPLGYGVPNFATPGGRNFDDDTLRRQNYDRFAQSLLTEVLPQAERAYTISNKRDDRAIAGLSMGGAESLLVGLNHLDTFSYVGAFSSGGFGGDFLDQFPKLSASDNQRIKRLWIACGTGDGLITPNRELVKWLQGKSLKVDAVETPGIHCWMVWRRNLAAFSKLLFKS